MNARLVKLASSPVPGEKIEALRDSQNSPEGKVDQNGKPRKSTRDSEADWTVKNDKPHYGIKEHTSVDTNNGLILSVNLTHPPLTMIHPTCPMR